MNQSSLDHMDEFKMQRDKLSISIDRINIVNKVAIAVTVAGFFLNPIVAIVGMLTLTAGLYIESKQKKLYEKVDHAIEDLAVSVEDVTVSESNNPTRSVDHTAGTSHTPTQSGSKQGLTAHHNHEVTPK